MKIAICMFGYSNYFFENINFHKSFFQNLEIDYYCHFWFFEENSRDFQKEAKIKSYLNNGKIIFEQQKIFKNNFDFEADITKTSKPVSHTISPLYSMKKCGEILDYSVNYEHKKYDYVACTRTDIACLDLKLYEQLEDKETIYTSYVPGPEWVPHKTGFAVDAKFICSSYENISYFLKLYDYYENYMKNDKIPLCHHRLFYHHLKKLNKTFKTLYSNDWYFYREHGLSRG